MQTIKTILKSIVAFSIFLAGMVFYAKVLDKPETTVENNYKKIKNKGQGNTISTENNTTVNTTDPNKKKKRKFRLFKKRNK